MAYQLENLQNNNSNNKFEFINIFYYFKRIELKEVREFK